MSNVRPLSKMDAAVRAAEVRDLKGILRLYRELRPRDPVLAPETALNLIVNLVEREDVHLLVGEVDGAVISTCMLAVIPNLASGGRPFGIIEHVVTLSSHRRRGYARLLLEHALALAWSRHCYKVMLLSGMQRMEAHRLYESVGFVGNVERGFVAKPRSAV
jgi:GNAT superfamily N-acetyltransferase